MTSYEASYSRALEIIPEVAPLCRDAIAALHPDQPDYYILIAHGVFPLTVSALQQSEEGLLRRILAFVEELLLLNDSAAQYAVELHLLEPLGGLRVRKVHALMGVRTRLLAATWM